MAVWRVWAFAAAGMLAAALPGCGSDAVLRNPDIELPTAPRVDLQQFSGKWFEIARLDHEFERGCHGATQTFTPSKRETYEVRFACFDGGSGGKLRETTGKATVIDPIGRAKFDMSLGGFFGRLWSGEYWILGVAEDYSWALAAGEEGENLWILSRQSRIAKPLRDALLIRLQSLGYDTSALVWIEHDDPRLRAIPEGPEPAPEADSPEPRPLPPTDTSPPPFTDESPADDPGDVSDARPVPKPGTAPAPAASPAPGAPPAAATGAPRLIVPPVQGAPLGAPVGGSTAPPSTP